MEYKTKSHPYDGIGIYDIETGQGDPKQIIELSKPFKEFQPLPEFDSLGTNTRIKIPGDFDPGQVNTRIKLLGEFDPQQVNIGNLTDEAKINAKISAAREKHNKDAAEALARHNAKIQEAREKHEKDKADAISKHNAKIQEARKKYEEKAVIEADKYEDEKLKYYEGLFTKSPLNPMFGPVLCIGILEDNGDQFVFGANDEPEEEIIGSFWEWVDSQFHGGKHIAGWNTHQFDLPFLIRRSFMCGVQPSPGIMDSSRRFFNTWSIDLMKFWTCGLYGEYAKLDMVARALGFKGKEKEEVTGENFHHYWGRGGDDRDKALSYLAGDLVATRQLAERFLFLPNELF